jgi:hypothetical protein
MVEYYITIFIVISIIIFTIVSEIKDRQKIPDLPDCSYITNYCTPYGKTQNIKYVIKEPDNNTTIKLLLSKIENDCSRMSNLVYWRMSLIVSIIITLLFITFNKLEGTNIKNHTYLYLLLTSWFFNYWMRNYLDFHYHNHMYLRVKESVAQLRSKITKT